MANPAKLEVLKRTKAKKDFKSFVLLKWERYEKKPFMDNWHYDYLCKILEHTLPNNNLASGIHLRDCKDFKRTADQTIAESHISLKGGQGGLNLQEWIIAPQECEVAPLIPPLTPQTPDNALQGLRFTRFDVTQNHSMILQSENPHYTQDSVILSGSEKSSRDTSPMAQYDKKAESAQETQDTQTNAQDSKIFDEKGAFWSEQATQETTQSGSIFERKSPFSSEQARSLLSVSAAACERRIGDLSQKDNADSTKTQELITRLMLNMPPSYGKTEIIARCFIAWALGNYPQRKFIYISYSDELCRKISNQVRDLIKSPFFASIFGRNPLFLQDNANEFVLKEGGGLFVTTLKSAITGFHAHQILIDDPIKVSAMNSKAERNLVNQNFKESVLSRLQDNKSNITILMQRLGDEDLCGFLLDKKNFESDIINEWKQISLKAINKQKETYTIGDYSYIREPNTPLFPQRHSLKELEFLRLQMGEDEFSTQYLQEPMVSEAGFFELAYFKEIPSYECQNQNLYIFVDSALSLNANADNRAIVLIGVENYENTLRYVVRDCVFGIWEESQTIQELISLMLDNPKAKVYIESDGGGLTLERLLLSELVRVNNQRKINAQSQITNTIKCYTPSRKISKVEKIKALKPFYNTGFLVFLHNARGLGQIKKELLGFNPAKPFRKDDCIDCIASCVAHSEVIAPSFGAKAKESKSPIERLRQKARSQRVAWNF